MAVCFQTFIPVLSRFFELTSPALPAAAMSAGGHIREAELFLYHLTPRPDAPTGSAAEALIAEHSGFY